MRKCSRIQAEISFDAIDHNLEVMSRRLGDETMLCAVVKANSYGHGALQIARHIQHRKNLWGFACATCEEAMELRHGGIMKPVMLLGYAFPESYDDIVDYDIRACVFDYESAQALSEKARQLAHDVFIHVALDTGMSRIGFADTEASVETIAKIAALPRIRLEGLFTHFDRCDEKSLAPAQVQLIRYLHFANLLEDKGIKIPILHASNSAGIMRFPEAKLDLARAGITLYGLMPSMEVAAEMTDLEPVMRIVSHVTHVKTVPAGVAVSYGGTYVTQKETRIATVPVGYADGYPRSLSNKGEILIAGKRVPIIGRVCMDQFMADVTELDDVKVGDEVVLLGRQGEECLSAEELGEKSGRFNYELVSCISMRVPRTFILNGVPVEQVDYLR